MSAGQHHENYAENAPPLPSERSTGLVFCAAFVVLAILVRSMPLMAGAALAVALAFGAAAWLAPHFLTGLNRHWFRLAIVLNRVVSPVVMALLYGVVIVPAGLVMQRVRDPLQRHGRAARDTYWIDRAQLPPQSSMRDQF